MSFSICRLVLKPDLIKANRYCTFKSYAACFKCFKLQCNFPRHFSSQKSFLLSKGNLTTSVLFNKKFSSNSPDKENEQNKEAPPKENEQNKEAPPKENEQNKEAPPKENEQSYIVPPDNPVSIRNRLLIAAIFLSVVGIGFYFAEESKRTKKIKDREVTLSKVDIGAQDYNLTDNTGKRVSKKDFLGKWLLLYFGFTHCPDICPEELERMSEIVEEIDNDKSIADIQPIFLSVDPDRDTPEAITAYLADFHPKFIGLTGTSDEVKQATKAFRVYYQAGPKDSDNDYIVDHTIVMYLMNPKGNFVDYYGSRSTPIEKIVDGITTNMENYARLHG